MSNKQYVQKNWVNWSCECLGMPSWQVKARSADDAASQYIEHNDTQMKFAAEGNSITVKVQGAGTSYRIEVKGNIIPVYEAEILEEEPVKAKVNPGAEFLTLPTEDR